MKLSKFNLMSIQDWKNYHTELGKYLLFDILLTDAEKERIENEQMEVILVIEKLQKAQSYQFAK
jgi:hypothetical protein